MTLLMKRPMLAAPLLPPNVEHTDERILEAMNKLRYPVLATLKKDGIRALRLGGSLVSRTFKPIPNRSIRERSLKLPGGFDMELWNPSLSYDEVESIVMSREHERSDEVQFHVLDWFREEPYSFRCERVQAAIDYLWNDTLFIYPVRILDAKTLLNIFLTTEQEQGEGICFRLPNSPYKQGRSTLKEQYLVKLCRYSRTELTITDYEEQYENTNRIERNALGLVDRSSSQRNLVGKNTLGAFICTHPIWGVVRVGTGVGLTDRLRKEIWENKERYKGREIVVKYKGHGMKNKPRSPIYVGFREKGF